MLSATNLQVDLGAFASNLRGIRALIGDRAILVAVKANAYGHGAGRISRFLEDERLADSLGVASVGEAAELREAESAYRFWVCLRVFLNSLLTRSNSAWS